MVQQIFLSLIGFGFSVYSPNLYTSLTLSSGFLLFLPFVLMKVITILQLSSQLLINYKTPIYPFQTCSPVRQNMIQIHVVILMCFYDSTSLYSMKIDYYYFHKLCSSGRSLDYIQICLLSVMQNTDFLISEFSLLSSSNLFSLM